MRMRHAAVVAGLALGLMSTAARATTLEYSVFVPVGSTTVSGTIDTDAKAGSLAQSDIVAFDLFFGSDEISSTDGDVHINGDSLFAIGNQLNFSFDGNSGNEANFLGNNPQDFDNFTLDAGFPGTSPFIQAAGPTTNNNMDIPSGTVLTIGVTEGTVMSPVPLPASAPMFGAALLALGAVGYGVKRKKAAAAA